MKKIFLISVASLCTVIGGMTQSAEALPVGADYNECFITAAGHRWLSPIYSLDIGYIEMLSNLGTLENEYYGLRYATTGEIFQLAERYGFAPSDRYPGGSYYESTSEFAMDEFQADFGMTTPIEALTRGYVATPLEDIFPPEDWDRSHPFYPRMNVAYFAGTSFVSDVEYCMINTQWYFDAVPYIGSWLVMDTHPVPEPTTVLLLGSGLLSLLAASRKRQR